MLPDRRLDRLAVVMDGPQGEPRARAHQGDRDLAARGLEERARRARAAAAWLRAPDFADARTSRLAGDRRVSFPPGLAAAVSPAAHGTRGRAERHGGAECEGRCHG